MASREIRPPQGFGQGNGVALGGWAVISSPILEGMRHSGHGASLPQAVSGGSVELVGGVFMDDTYLVEALTYDDPFGLETVARGQLGLDQFVGEIRATGGDVRPDKCWWYLINFAWKEGKWQYVDIGKEDPSL